MPPRLRVPTRSSSARPITNRQNCQYASFAVASAITPAPPIDPSFQASTPVRRYPSKQPPSYKPPEFRKSQLLRQYASLLYSSPVMLLFQHNNLRSIEWVAIRRELVRAMRKVDEELATSGQVDSQCAESVKVHILQTGIFAAALNVVEYFHPERQTQSGKVDPNSQSPTPAASIGNLSVSDDQFLTHVLSKAASEAAAKGKHRKSNRLAPLLSGPLAVVSFPGVSPAHVAAALSILSPNSQFAAPKRRSNPLYHEFDVQSGLQKLLLLGARVEGRVFDDAGARWVGGIQGGIHGLRAHLVAMLQGFGARLTTTLDSSARNLWLTVEGRRTMLEEGEKKDEEQGDIV